MSSFLINEVFEMTDLNTTLWEHATKNWMYIASTFTVLRQVPLLGRGIAIAIIFAICATSQVSNDDYSIHPIKDTDVLVTYNSCIVIP